MPVVGIDADGMDLSARLRCAAERACRAMIVALERNSPGLVHVLQVPRLLPTGEVAFASEKAHTFPRATVVEALLDARAAGLAIPEDLIMRECGRLIRSKREDSCGGWSYLENVPELPPDLDDLGTITRTLMKAGGTAFASCCQEAIDLCHSTSCNLPGALNTWILDPASPCDRFMRRYSDITRSGGCHAEVLANFLTAIRLFDTSAGYYARFSLSADYLATLQQEDGSWRTDFYGSRCYSTMRAVMALNAFDYEGPAAGAAVCFLRRTQATDGSWNCGDALATACALAALADCQSVDDSVRDGLRFLLAAQEADGLWRAGVFVRVGVQMRSRSGMSVRVNVQEQKSREITTAFCVNAIVACR